MQWTITNKKVLYKDREVTGRILTIQSHVPVNIEDAWDRVTRSSTLEFVAKGMMTFKPLEKKFPEYWKADQEVKTKILMWGFLPMGGIHTIKFLKIDKGNYTLKTTEEDATAKVWNHTIILKSIDSSSIEYTDSIEIYAGWMTGLVTWWAKYFYRHRHQRWQLFEKEGS
jgi:hypothetical protein